MNLNKIIFFHKSNKVWIHCGRNEKKGINKYWIVEAILIAESGLVFCIPFLDNTFRDLHYKVPTIITGIPILHKFNI